MKQRSLVLFAAAVCASAGRTVITAEAAAAPSINALRLVGPVSLSAPVFVPFSVLS